MSERKLYVSPATLHRQIRAGKPVTLLDVRSPAEYRAGHVRGAKCDGVRVDEAAI